MVIQELRQEHDLKLLLEIAQIPRATFYYHAKRMVREDKYAIIKTKITELFPERYDGQKLLRGVLNMQANNLRMYAVCFGIRGFFAYAKELFRHEQIQTAYREIEEMPREYKFPAVCQRNRWEKLYLLWCLYIGKFGFLKSALRPAYKYLRSLLRR